MEMNGTNELDAPTALPAPVDTSALPAPKAVAAPVPAAPVVRVLVPDSSPEQQRVIAALPPRVDGHKEMDDGDGISIHFGGRSTGMGKSASNDSNAAVEPVVASVDEEQPRKRIRRGPVRYEDGGSTVASSQVSAVTSPAESDHSSAPAITSPAEDAEPTATGAIRDHLAQFKVDSAPSSAPSSAYGGSSSNLMDLEIQPIPVRKPSELQASMTIDSSSPPAIRQLSRMTRGKRPEVAASPQEVAALGSIDLRSPSQPIAPPPPFLTSSSIAFTIPPFNPVGGSRAPPPAPVVAPVVAPLAPPPIPLAVPMQLSLLQTANAEFQQFVAMVPPGFPIEVLHAAWTTGNFNLNEAFKLLVTWNRLNPGVVPPSPTPARVQPVHQSPYQQYPPGYPQPGQPHVSPQVRQQFPYAPGQPISPQQGFLQYPQQTTSPQRGMPLNSNGAPMTAQQLHHAQLYRQEVLHQQAYAHQQARTQAGARFPVQHIPPRGRPPKASTSQAVAPPPLQSLMARTMASHTGTPTTKKRKKVQHSDSDGDGGEYSDGSGDEYGGPTPAVLARRDNLALEFFNTESRENICELAGCNATQATLVIKLRPFTSTTDFRTRTRKQKGVGNMLMDTYNDVIEGMLEVDKLLSDCEQIGVDLSKIMKIWAGTSSDPTAASGVGADVGLNLVDIPEEKVLTQAAQSTDPAVQSAFKGYLRTQPEGVPSNIKLKDYQMLGVNWLNLLYSRNTSCILADEMGLGKTAQVIALMSHLKSNGEKGPHLVIVPSSTLENWMREFSVFAPGLIVASYYGSQADRAELRYELKAMEELDVVVTTYNIATSSVDDQKFLKKKLSFKIAVFDEGHQLKNSESKKYKDLMQIKAQWRLLLTGTPLQNNLQELVSLLSFILPNQFRDANESLRAIFKVGPGSQANLLSSERINRAKKMMTPFVLRRKKAQVLKDLPKKIETVEWCEMTDLQQEVYSEAMMRSRMALSELPEADIEQLGEEVDGDEEEGAVPKKKGKATKSSTKNGKISDGNSGSNVLMDLRKASNHPMLFRRLYPDKVIRLMAKDCLKELDFADRDKDVIFEDMQVMTDFELHRFAMPYKHLKKYCLQNDEWMSAGKIQALMRLLPELKKQGHRVLLFSQFTQILDILEVVLGTMGLRYLKLTGQTPVTERQGLVDEYSGDPDITVFLLSTRAGGLGLNLTSANTVIFYDQDYNPQNDLQAEDRAYRIGQTRDVTIIKLLARGTIDEDMHSLGAHKLLLDSSVSSTSQYPANVAAAEDAASGGGEKKMRTSLLNNLKKNFNKVDGAAGASTQAGGPLSSPKKE